ncbi:MAG: DNA gyrase inhibitor YacG [Rhizobacter sp.]|nr:DNA gyrase inhibitor YacG [Rhizobacter sp.]
MSQGSSTPRPLRRIVSCPTCGGDSLYAPENPYRPFCSERCKNVDFGAWASESYRVPARPPLPGEQDADETTGRIESPSDRDAGS